MDGKKCRARIREMGGPLGKVGRPTVPAIPAGPFAACVCILRIDGSSVSNSFSSGNSFLVLLISYRSGRHPEFAVGRSCKAPRVFCQKFVWSQLERLSPGLYIDKE